MSQSSKKPLAIALGTALAGGLALSGSAFAITPLAQGYMAGAAAQTMEKKSDSMKSGDMKDMHEGKCGEGRCGMDTMDGNKDGMISAAEHAAAAQAMFEKADANHDGMVSADEMKAMHEGKCGEGKCGSDKKMDAGADKAAMEGKCGEGKCGGDMQASGK